MILDNFKQWFKIAIKGASIPTGGVNYMGSMFSMGSSYFLGTAISTNDYITNNTQYNRFTVLYGKGKTPPTPSDYALEDIITSGWEHLALTSSYSNDAVIISDVITNSSTEDIEINEIAINGKLNSQTSSCLMYREVLDKPLILKPNDVYTFTIKLALE